MDEIGEDEMQMVRNAKTGLVSAFQFGKTAPVTVNRIDVRAQAEQFSQG